MYSLGWEFWILMGAVIWLVVLTVMVWQLKGGTSSNKKLLQSVFEGESDEVKLDQLVRKINGLGVRADDIKEGLESVKQESLGHIQRVELLRYNPYDDTGGDQSFTISLLDKNGDGVIITSLHSRAGTRVFAKPVKEGKSEKYDFSDEEKQVVKKAMEK